MKTILNCGFGSPVGVATLQDLKLRGFSGIRQDIHTAASAADLVQETLDAGMPSLFILRDPEVAKVVARALRGSPALGIECGNEEDSKMTPKDYHAWFLRMSAAIRGVSVQPMIWTAGITTTDKKRLKWLEQVYELGIPYEVGVLFHSYRQEKPPSVAHDGFKSRADEIKYLRTFTGDRRMANSELGYHTAPYRVRKNWFQTVERRWNDEQVASHLQGELTVLKGVGCEFATVFQFQDNAGPSTVANYEGRFGIRRIDGTWKPQAMAVADWVGRNL